MLLRAKQIAHAAEAQVRARNRKSVLGVGEDRQSFRGVGAYIAEQNAVGLLATTSNAATQLVQLRQAESLRVLNDHDGGVRDVDANLNHGRRNENIQQAVAKAAHHVISLVRRHPAVQQCHASRRKRSGHQFLVHRGRRAQIHLLRRFDQRIHDVHLTSSINLDIGELHHLVAR